MNKCINYRELASNTVVRSFFTENKGMGEMPSALADAVVQEMEKLSPLYKAISLIPIRTYGGTVRLVSVGGDGEWVSCGEPMPEITDTTKIIGEVSGYTIGACAEICTSLLSGSAEAITDYIFAVARALIRPLEKAILYGDGKNKPRGIIPALADDHIVPTDKNGSELYGYLVEAAGLADANYMAGPNEFHAVCNRKTAMCMLHAANNTDASAYPVVIPQIMAKITLCEAMKDGEALLGFLPAYHLYERKALTVDASRHTKFLADNAVIRGVGNYDGLTIEPSAFALVKMYAFGAVDTIEEDGNG